METLTTLLASLRSQGFALWCEQGGLKVSPASRLTAEQRQQVQDHKADLLALLTRPKPPAPPPSFRRTADAWDAVTASKFVQLALALVTAPGFSGDPQVRLRQIDAAHGIDDAFLANDMAGLRSATATFSNLFNPTK